MAVTVQLRGGLGNQLFQYAAGYALATRHNEPLLIDTALLALKQVNGRVTQWTEQISGFAHEGQIIDSAGPSPSKRRIARRLAGAERKLGDIEPGTQAYAHGIQDNLEQFQKLKAGAHINAYCNSYHHFESAQTKIRQQVSTPINPGNWFLEEQKKMWNEKPVALHVRWGDYLNLKHIYGTIAPTYYQRAIELVIEVTGDRPIWLFSDDPQGAKDYLHSTINITHIVEPAASSTALENLLLLSTASGLVCANSTFSWWAAFLAENVRTVFPRPLFGITGPPDPKDWLMPDWIQIGR